MPRTPQVTCLDYSLAALTASRALLAGRTRGSSVRLGAALGFTDSIQMQFLHGDATNMPFRAGSFDLVLDKGTTDSVLKCADRWCTASALQ